MSKVKKWYIGVYGGEAQARTCSPHAHEVIRDTEGDTFVLSRDYNAAQARESVLQQRLTAADERLNLLEGLLLERDSLVTWWKERMRAHLCILFGAAGKPIKDAERSADQTISREELLAPQVSSSTTLKPAEAGDNDH